MKRTTKKNSAPGNLKSVKGIMLEEDENQINKIKHRIKNFFIKRAIGEYIVVKDDTVNNRLIILGEVKGNLLECIIVITAEWSLRMKFS